MKCIKCGQELEWQLDLPPSGKVLGYKCINPDCEIYNEEWSTAEHKDNQDWAIRHIRALEAENQTLRDEVDYFNLIFPSYADAINLLKARIENLESKL